MRRLIGLWFVIFYIVPVAGCVPTISEPAQSEPVPTVLSQPSNTLVPTFTPIPQNTPAAFPVPEGSPVPTNTPILEPVPIATDTPPPNEANVQEMTIVIAGDSEVYQIKIGETFTFQAPRGTGWQIGYDQNLLTLLTPVELHEQPGDDWVFQANQETGRTRIWVTNVPPPCEGELCPPAAGAEILMESLIEIVNE
jgi:hypothetical protein